MRGTVATRAAARSGTALSVNPITLDELPPSVLREILRRLPVDQRARVACVCRRWRDVLADPTMWTVLDLTAPGIMHAERVTHARLLAAAAMARGRLEVLVFDHIRGAFMFHVLLAIATANTASLREVRSLTLEEHGGRYDGRETEHGVDEAQALLLAAPALQVLEANVTCGFATARRMLRNEPPFGPLRLVGLQVDCQNADRDIAALSADLAAHRGSPLTSLVLFCDGQPFMEPLRPDELESLVTAALPHRLDYVGFFECGLTPATVPALCRLLSSTTLTDLRIVQLTTLGQLLDEQAAGLLAEALRANRTLVDLSLEAVLDASACGALVVLALVGHPRLRKLRCELVSGPDVLGGPATGALFGAALGALIAGNSPALQQLSLDQGFDLDEATLGPLCDALPRNTHLQELCLLEIPMSAAFAAQRLLPAVRANNSLRRLMADDVAEEAVRLVEARVEW